MSKALRSLFTDQANAIREGLGDIGKITPADFPTKIREIVGMIGAGGSSADVCYVTFKSDDGTVEYGKKAVAFGDNCADPIARGVFGKPTKESTAQFNFTHDAWATEPNGATNPDALKAVTEDRVVYATFISVLRYYTITYYDGETLHKIESLAYGTMPSCIIEKDGYNFEGWEPALTTVTGDATYYAQFSEKLTFAGASWADVAEISANGTSANTFNIGDKKDVQITYADGTSATMVVRIAGFNHDSLADGSGKAGISIVCKTVPNYKTQWYSTQSNTAYYNESLVHAALSEGGDIWNMLPDELTSLIKPVKKLYDNSYQTGTSGKTTEINASLWALSVDEIGISTGSNIGSPGSTMTSVLGAKYELFPYKSGSSKGTDEEQRFEPMAANDTNYVSTWLRTIGRSGTNNPFYFSSFIQVSGKPNYEISTTDMTKEKNIAFGFCI